MAFDAPRKTLDDIRRELDAEFGTGAVAHTPSDGDGSDRAQVVDDDGAVGSVIQPPVDRPARRMRNVAPASDDLIADEGETAPYGAAVVASARSAMQAPRRRGGYIVVGVIGCLVGQLILLGFMAVMRHRPVSAPGLQPSVAGVETTSETSTAGMATAPAETASTVAGDTTFAPPAVVAPARPEAPPTSAVAALEMPAAPSTPAARFLPPAAPPIPSAAPPASIATPAPLTSDRKAMSRRLVKRPPTAPRPPAFVATSPSAPRVRPAPHSSSADSPNWSTSQEEIRAALSQWLAASGRADQSIVSDTVVFLGADGRTARTHVPIRWGGEVVIREQRWVRGLGGWTLMDDREVSRR